MIDFSFIYAGCAGFIAMLGMYLTIPAFKDKFRTVFRLPTPSIGIEIGGLDSLRGIFAMWVVLYHSYQWLGGANDPGTYFIVGYGTLAVNAFCIISGFLIYRSALKIGSFTGAASYLKRRFLRIYPLYFFSIAAIFLGGWVSAGNITAWNVISNIFMFRLFGASNYVNPPAWSLYIEEGFYLLLPFWIFLFRSRAKACAALFYVVCAVIFSGSKYGELIPCFLIGIFGSQLLIESPGYFKKHRFLAAGLLLFLADMLAWRGHSILLRLAPGLGISGWTLDLLLTQVFNLSMGLVVFSVASGGAANNLLHAYPLRVVGIVSYSVYLLHGLIITAGTSVIFDGFGRIAGTPAYGAAVHSPLEFYALYITAILFFSCVTYALIEYPFLRLRSSYSVKVKIK